MAGSSDSYKVKGLLDLKNSMNRFTHLARDEGCGQALIVSSRYILTYFGYYCSLFKAFLKDLHLSHIGSFLDSIRMIQLVHKVKNYTGLGLPRLVALYKLSGEIDRLSVPGDIAELGVRNGGSAAIMAFVSDKSPLNRNIWLFDAFEELPELAGSDGDKAQSECHKWKYFGSVSKAGEIFHQLRIPEGRVHIVPGWFEDTFPSIQIQALALLHIDVGLYESVKLCLDKFYDSVCPGGFIVFDNYGQKEGCRRATNEFLKKRSLNVRLTKVDFTGHYFQKPQKS